MNLTVDRMIRVFVDYKRMISVSCSYKHLPRFPILLNLSVKPGVTLVLRCSCDVTDNIPVSSNNLSASVLLPWSMWAIMLKFLILSTGNSDRSTFGESTWLKINNFVHGIPQKNMPVIHH